MDTQDRPDGIPKEPVSEDQVYAGHGSRPLLHIEMAESLNCHSRRNGRNSLSCKLGLAREERPIVIAVYVMGDCELLGLDDAVADGVAHQVHRILQSQLVQDVCAMGLHSTGTDNELLGNILVAQPVD